MGMGTPQITAGDLWNHRRRLNVNPLIDLMRSFFFLVGNDSIQALMDADDGLKSAFSQYYDAIRIFLPTPGPDGERVMCLS